MTCAGVAKSGDLDIFYEKWRLERPCRPLSGAWRAILFWRKGFCERLVIRGCASIRIRQPRRRALSQQGRGPATRRELLPRLGFGALYLERPSHRVHAWRTWPTRRRLLDHLTREAHIAAARWAAMIARRSSRPLPAPHQTLASSSRATTGLSTAAMHHQQLRAVTTRRRHLARGVIANSWGVQPYHRQPGLPRARELMWLAMPPSTTTGLRPRLRGQALRATWHRSLVAYES